MNLGDKIIQGREKNIMSSTERKVNQNKGLRTDYSIVRWYALTHLDPDALKRRIDEVNSQLKRSGSNTWYDYFIPYSFIRQRSLPNDASEEFQGNFSEKDVKDNNRIRNILPQQIEDRLRISVMKIRKYRQALAVKSAGAGC